MEFALHDRTIVVSAAEGRRYGRVVHIVPRYLSNGDRAGATYFIRNDDGSTYQSPSGPGSSAKELLKDEGDLPVGTRALYMHPALGRLDGTVVRVAPVPDADARDFVYFFRRDASAAEGLDEIRQAAVDAGQLLRLPSGAAAFADARLQPGDRVAMTTDSGKIRYGRVTGAAAGGGGAYQIQQDHNGTLIELREGERGLRRDWGDLRVGDRTLCYEGPGGGFVRGVVTRVLPWAPRSGFTYFVTHDSGAVGEFNADDIAQGYLCRA